MNLRQLQTLITIADAGGFAGAAGRLNLSQPAASRQIQALEAELGVLLFDRIGRRLQLTSEGELKATANAVERQHAKLGLQTASIWREAAGWLNSSKTSGAGKTAGVGDGDQRLQL